MNSQLKLNGKRFNPKTTQSFHIKAMMNGFDEMGLKVTVISPLY